MMASGLSSIAVCPLKFGGGLEKVVLCTTEGCSRLERLEALPHNHLELDNIYSFSISPGCLSNKLPETASQRFYMKVEVPHETE